MKHGHMGDAFFDLDAASFLLTELTDTFKPEVDFNALVDSAGRECSPSHSQASTSTRHPSPVCLGPSIEQVDTV